MKRWRMPDDEDEARVFPPRPRSADLLEVDGHGWLRMEISDDVPSGEVHLATYADGREVAFVCRADAADLVEVGDA